MSPRATPLMIGLLLSCSAGACAKDGVEVAGVAKSQTVTPDALVAVDFADAPDDASFPDVDPEVATGVVGFSRYVWTTTSSGAVVPLLVEGPRGAQARCQAAALPCSFEELAELAASDATPPPELGMSSTEVASLVDQLAATRRFLTGFDSIGQACAAGYAPETQQNPNMGIHMTRTDLLDDVFDPAQPEMLLWGKPGGEEIPRPRLGDCVDGGWTGDDDYVPVGAAFLLTMTPEHPEGFAGPIDNWHIHYSACSGATTDAIQGDEASCLEAGGVFFDRTPVWMMHAYVAEGFESQEGVFAMYNSAIWPLGSNLDLSARRTEVQDTDGAVVAPIIDFDFGAPVVKPGEPIVFANSDALPHTVTAGSPGAPSGEFDSGVMAAGGTFTVALDVPGEHRVY